MASDPLITPDMVVGDRRKGINRTALPLPGYLKEQLAQIHPSIDNSVQYFPCAVVKTDGSIDKFVCFIAEEEFIRHWGDPERRENFIPLSDVSSIKPSEYRLPAVFADKLYQHGEVGMGYYRFIVHLASGRSVYCLTGNFVDFPGLTPQEIEEGITSVQINNTVARPRQDGDRETKGYDFSWCLFKGA